MKKEKKSGLSKVRAGYKRRAVMSSLKRSTWITAGWNWLLTLASRAAEAVLTVTILYSTVQIFTNTNPSVDFAMFLGQQIALDAGGMGLIKIANQAKKDGFEREAKKAKVVAITLMVLMGLGVIISEVESKITTTAMVMNAAHHLVSTTLDFKQSYPAWSTAIEIILLCVRGAMAIYYGFTIHDLESSIPSIHGHDEHQPVANADVPGGLNDWQMVGLSAFLLQSTQAMVAEIQANCDQKIQALSDQVANFQATIQADFQALQALPIDAPPVDTQAIFQAVFQAVSNDLGAQFQAKIQAVDQALLRQNTVIAEVVSQAKRLPESAASPQAKPKQIQAPQAEQKVIRLVAANATRDEMIAEAIRLRDEEKLSTYKIAERLGKSAKTVQSWLSSGNSQATIQADDEDVEAMS